METVDDISGPNSDRLSRHSKEAERPGSRAFSASSVVLLVAATCFLGVIWGAVDGNWVLVAAEVPAVLALGLVWIMTRNRDTKSEAAKAASVIGLLCVVELWLATSVFDLRGVELAALVTAKFRHHRRARCDLLALAKALTNRRLDM